MTWNSSQYNQVWNAVFNPISGLPTPEEVSPEEYYELLAKEEKEETK